MPLLCKGIMKELSIGKVKLDNPVILAPMAGVTNYAYRRLLKEFGCSLVVTEMISDHGLIYDNGETKTMLYTKDEIPLSVQLFGGDKENLVKATKILCENYKFDILDLNMGCPVPKVVKGNSGSSWLKEDRQEELYETVKAVVEASTKPVTVKIRLGWDETSVTAEKTCEILEKAGVSMIAIHGRTRSQFYAGKATFDIIKKCKENSNIPIIANGDINSIDDAIKVLEYTGCDGVMIGRGALGNPNLIKQLATYFKTGERLPDSTLEEQVSYCKKHFEYLMELKGEYRANAEMRGLASHYFKGFEGAKNYRGKLSQCKTKNEFMAIMDEILEQNK